MFDFWSFMSISGKNYMGNRGWCRYLHLQLPKSGETPATSSGQSALEPGSSDEQQAGPSHASGGGDQMQPTGKKPDEPQANILTSVSK